MPKFPIRILLIEDDLDSATLVRHYLTRNHHGEFEVDWEQEADQGLSEILKDRHDLYILDYHLGSRNGLDILREAIGQGCTAPFIMLTAEENRDVDMEAMKAGAVDYLWKKHVNPTLLERSIRYAIERKQTENKYRQLFNKIADPIFIFDRETHKFLDCNDSALRVYGYSKDELQKMTPFDLLPEEERKHMTRKIDSRNVDRPNIYTHITKTGRRIRVEPLTDEIDFQDRSAWISIARDVTQREQAFQETELLLASISSILISLGPGDKITRWNSAAEETFGIKSKDVIGQSLINSNINWSWLEVLQAIEEFRGSKTPTRLNSVRYTRPSGKQGFLNLSINPIINDAFGDTGFLILADEVTERKALEHQLAQAQKLESIGQLAAGIAHEINTPIQYVGDNTRFLEDAFGDLKSLFGMNLGLLQAAKDSKVCEKQIEALENEIKKADLDYLIDEIPSAIKQTLEGVDRVASIVRAMKEFSHPGTDEKTSVDINKALLNTIEVARNEWKYVAEIDTQLDPSLPLIPCLPGELNQVFLNIIINAAHAISDAKGANGEKGTITVMTSHDNNSIEIRIQDSGNGIPEEIRANVFDPFFTTKEVGRGTGQGLAISHNVVVDKHGGTITFETELGKGTTFIIRLPVH